MDKNAQKWMALGAGMGVVLGAVAGNSGIGVALGAGIGMAFGSILDKRAKDDSE